MTTTQEAFDRLTGIDSTELGKSIAALAAIPRPPEPMARIILEVPMSELSFTLECVDDYPEVSHYGTKAEVCEESRAAVQDHFDSRRWNDHE